MIARATSDDLPKLLPLLRAFYSEVQGPSQFHEPTAMEMWQSLLSSTPPNGQLFYAEDQGAVLGILGAVRATDWYEPDHDILIELCWYVVPGTSQFIALGLLRAFHQWAEDCGVAETRMSHVFGERFPRQQEKMAKLYSRLGYRPLEVTYTRAAPSVTGKEKSHANF